MAEKVNSTGKRTKVKAYSKQKKKEKMCVLESSEMVVLFHSHSRARWSAIEGVMGEKADKDMRQTVSQGANLGSFAECSLRSELKPRLEPLFGELKCARK